MSYETKVRKYEAEGMSRSDAQSVVDAEQLRSEEIGRLMIRAERHDIPMVACLAQPDEKRMPGQDPFECIHTVAEFVTTQIDFDIEMSGEIDPTDESHYSSFFGEM